MNFEILSFFMFMSAVISVMSFLIYLSEKHRGKDGIANSALVVSMIFVLSFIVLGFPVADFCCYSPHKFITQTNKVHIIDNKAYVSIYEELQNVNRYTSSNFVDSDKVEVTFYNLDFKSMLGVTSGNKKVKKIERVP